MTKSPLLRSVVGLASLTVFAFPVVATAGDDSRDTTLHLNELANVHADRAGHVRVFDGRGGLLFAVNGRPYVRGQYVASGASFALCKESRGALESCLPILGSPKDDGTAWECKSTPMNEPFEHSCACSGLDDCLSMIKSGFCNGHEMNCTENGCTCDYGP
jgi:hypothetical protein